jgi:hypothetical protein
VDCGRCDGDVAETEEAPLIATAAPPLDALRVRAGKCVPKLTHSIDVF